MLAIGHLWNKHQSQINQFTVLFIQQNVLECLVYNMMTSSNGNIFRVTAGNSPVMNSLHKSQWGRVLVFSLICTWINCWVNNREAGDLRRHRAHYDVTVNVHCVPTSRRLICPTMIWRFMLDMINNSSVSKPTLFIENKGKSSRVVIKYCLRYTTTQLCKLVLIKFRWHLTFIFIWLYFICTCILIIWW